MQERIFTLKKGTEVPAKFDGVTVPFRVPSSLADIQSVCGNDEARVVSIFNSAYALMLQKSVKDETNEEGATVESVRKHAADYKPGQVRSRVADPNKPKTFSAAKRDVEREMLEEFLRSNPEAKAAYDAKVAAAKAKAATATTATPAAPTTPAAPATEPAAAPVATTGSQKRTK